MSVFTPEEVESLNKYQRSRAFHPFTCGGDRTDEHHLDGEGILVATEDGWICPYCPYTQNWAHDFMKNKEWKPAANIISRSWPNITPPETAPTPDPDTDPSS